MIFQHLPYFPLLQQQPEEIPMGQHRLPDALIEHLNHFLNGQRRHQLIEGIELIDQLG